MYCRLEGRIGSGIESTRGAEGQSKGCVQRSGQQQWRICFRWQDRHASDVEIVDIVRERRAISPEMAVLLSAYFGTSDAYWINLQAHFDLEIAKDKMGKRAARINPHPHDETGALRPI